MSSRWFGSGILAGLGYLAYSLYQNEDTDKDSNETNKTDETNKPNENITEMTEVNLDENESGISPGQACVFYSKNKFGDKVLGGGWITRTVNKYLST